MRIAIKANANSRGDSRRKLHNLFNRSKQVDFLDHFSPIRQNERYINLEQSMQQSFELHDSISSLLQPKGTLTAVEHHNKLDTDLINFDDTIKVPNHRNTGVFNQINENHVKNSSRVAQRLSQAYNMP